MSERKDGGRAYPGKVETGNHVEPIDGVNTFVTDYEDAPGMSLRDWFAGNGPWDIDNVIKWLGDTSGEESPASISRIVAQWNLLYADAMIKEREDYE